MLNMIKDRLTTILIWLPFRVILIQHNIKNLLEKTQQRKSHTISKILTYQVQDIV